MANLTNFGGRLGSGCHVELITTVINLACVVPTEIVAMQCLSYRRSFLLTLGGVNERVERGGGVVLLESRIK